MKMQKYFKDKYIWGVNYLFQFLQKTINIQNLQSTIRNFKIKVGHIIFLRCIEFLYLFIKQHLYLFIQQHIVL